MKVPEDNDIGYGDEEEGQLGVNLAETEPCISVTTLTDNQNFQTMHIKGIIHGKPLHIPVDSGSTHNFLHSSLAQVRVHS